MPLTLIDIKWRICKSGKLHGRFRQYYITISDDIKYNGYWIRIIWCHQVLVDQEYFISICPIERCKSFVEKAIIEHINDMPIELNPKQKSVIQEMRESKMIQWPYFFLASPTFGPLTRKQLDYLVEKDILHYECSVIRDTAYYSLTELGKNLEL